MIKRALFLLFVLVLATACTRSLAPSNSNLSDVLGDLEGEQSQAETQAASEVFVPAAPGQSGENGFQAFLPALRNNRPPAPVESPTATLIPVDPHVEIQAVPTSLAVGETLTVQAQAVDIGLPYFALYVRDTPEGPPLRLVEITYDNQINPQQDISDVLQFVSGSGELNSATFTLRALAPGTVILWVNATGEIHYGYPGPATWGGGGSEPVTIIVTG